MADKIIARELKVSLKTVRKWRKRTDVSDKKRTGRIPRLMSSPTRDIITELCEDQWNASPAKTAKILNASDDFQQRCKTVSASTVRRFIRSTEWGKISYKPTVKPLLSMKNIADRIAFCNTVIQKGYTAGTPDAVHLLDHILFTDESVVELWPKPNRQNTRIRTSNPEAKVVQVPKNGLKIMIAGGLASMGLTRLHICEPKATINGEYYRQKILPVYFHSIGSSEDPNLVSNDVLFERPSDVVFMQDGAPAHSARETMNLLSNRCSNVWGRGTWPGNSPDLNPIEHLWGVIQDSVFIEPRPRNRCELISRVQQTWDSITETETRRLVHSFPSRINQCREREGRHTDY